MSDYGESGKTEIQWFMGDTGRQGGVTVRGGVVRDHVHKPSLSKFSTVGGPTTTIGGLCEENSILGGRSIVDAGGEIRIT